MKSNFIPKLETEKYLIGSFDAYQEEAKELIKTNSNLTDEEADAILKSMPTTSRAAVLNKQGEFIGYIGLFNVDAKNDTASIRFEVNQELSEEDKSEIFLEFNDYAFNSLSVVQIPEYRYVTGSKTEVKTTEIIPSSNIVLTSEILVPGITEEDLEKFSKDYSIPKLQFPFTIKVNDRTIGLIGLSSLIWSNKRANLCLYLDKSLGSDIISELPGYLIDDYIDYVHSANVHNITFSVNGSNKDMLSILNNTNMNYYGRIPFGAMSDDNIESSYMFQHIPHMKKRNGLYVPNNQFISASALETEKKEISDVVDLGNGYRLVRPSVFEREGIDANAVLQGHIKAMQNRTGFTIPLGEDKYFLQQGNGNYGLSKSVNNFTYVVLNENNEYAGYINTLRTNANGKNVEVEIGIDPTLQHRGLGTSVMNAFYDELFSTGVASVTSSVFSFNRPSNRLHEKVAMLNGIRLESYYVNGTLWDMNIYSRVNSEIEGKGAMRF